MLHRRAFQKFKFTLHAYHYPCWRQCIALKLRKFESFIYTSLIIAKFKEMREREREKQSAVRVTKQVIFYLDSDLLTVYAQ